jgi:tetratricopeptide (TPR) repeat protein
VGQRWVRRLVRASIVPALALAALTASFDVGYGAERVGVRGGLHATFARLVFDWSGPVAYQVAATDQQLTVTFERPMEGQFDGARRAISDYIGNVRFEDEGKRVVIELKRPVQTSHFVNEQSVVVDLRPTDGAAATAAPEVPVQISDRNGYTRIVFDWPVRTDYRFSQKDARVSLSFARPGELTLPALAASSTALVTNMQSTRRGDGTAQVEIDVAGRVRHFRDGRKVVVDVLPNKNAKPGASEDPATQSPPQAADAAAPPAGAETKVGAPVQLVPQRLQPADNAEAALPDDAGTLDVAVRIELDGVGLAFPFDEPTALAAFRRGGWLWLVFDRPFRIDTGPIAAAEEFISAVEQLEHGQATVLRLMTTPGFNASVAREENRWEIVVAPQLMRPENTLKVTANPGRDANVTLGPTTPTTPLVLNDPEVGDQIFAVTVSESGHGVARSHQFSDFRLLPSVQGVAVVPYSDDLKVVPRAKQIVISAAGGLRLAAAQTRRRVLATTTEKANAERMFDFNTWRHSEVGGYEAARSHLLAQIESALPDARNKARLELARFYFAHGMGARARGILQLVAVESDDAAHLATFRALRGAVNYIMGDFENARHDLLERDLDSEPEIGLWRAALAAEDGEYGEATFGLRQSDRFVQSYPDNLRKRFAFLGAETALANSDARGGEFWLEIGEGASLSGADREYKQVLQANILALDGEIDTALKMYDVAIQGRDRRSRARAALEKTELLLAEDEIEPEQAIEDLDRLRYVWRGDGIEFRVLRRLGELQIETGKFRDGLQSLKRLVTNFADHRLAPGIAESMRNTFADLYEAGTIETLPPVMAIALFNDFRELAPAGTEGDEMIRRLTDRLVSVDLLPQAAKLLSHQVEFRLKGEDKARVGARLAVIHLLNRDPGQALASIADSHSDGIPSELDQERALITARANTQLGAYEKALAALDGNESEAADKVRADIMWQKRDWASAAAVFGRLAGEPPAGRQTLDEVHSRYVLSRAVALALSGDLRELATLYQRFSPAMAATPYGTDFQVIASVDSGAADFQDVLRRISVADDFQAFMDGYRARLAQSATAS